MRLKSIPTRFRNAVVSELIPSVLAGVISGWLEGKSAEDFYRFTKNHSGQNWFAELIPEATQRKMRGLAHGQLEWLTLPWFIGAVVGEHPDIVSLIASSPAVRDELGRQLEGAKTLLGS